MTIEHRFRDGVRLSDPAFNAFRYDITRVVEQMRSRPTHRFRPNSESTLAVFIAHASQIVRGLHALGASSFTDANRRTWDAWAASIRERDPIKGKPRLSAGYQHNLFGAAMMLWRYNSVMKQSMPVPPIVDTLSAEVGVRDRHHRKTLPLSDSELDRLGGLCWGFVITAPYVLGASRIARNAYHHRRDRGYSATTGQRAANDALRVFLNRTEPPKLPCPLTSDANLRWLQVAQMDLATACTLLWTLFSGQRGSEVLELTRDCLITAPWAEDASNLAIRGRLRKGLQIPGGIDENWSATAEHEQLARILLALNDVRIHKRSSDYLVPRYLTTTKTGHRIPAATFRAQVERFLERHGVRADDGTLLRAHPRRLRVTFSRLFAERPGAPLHQLQWQLKHADENMTELFYWNRSDNDQARRLAETRLRDVTAWSLPDRVTEYSPPLSGQPQGL